MLTFNFNPFPVLQTARFVLRRVVRSDAPMLWKLRNTDEVMQYIDRVRQKDITETEAFIEKIDEMIDANRDINWGIAFIENPDEMIGTIGFYRTQHEHFRGEVGYMLHPAFWRKGIMFEVLQKVIAFGFEDLHFHTITACINPHNMASRNLLIKSGFVKEAYFKEDYYFNGKFKDTEVFTKFSSTSNPVQSK